MGPVFIFGTVGATSLLHSATAPLQLDTLPRIADETPLSSNLNGVARSPIVFVSKETPMNKLTFAFLSAVAVLSFSACKKKGGDDSGAAMAKMSEFKDEMCKCKDAKCAQDVSDKMTKWSQEQAKNQKEPPKMSEADTKKAAEIGEQMGKCMQDAMGAGGEVPAGDTAAPGGDTPAAAAGDMPAECAEYKAAIDKLATCDKMPPAAREALVKAFDDASAGWANLPAEAKAGLATSCKAGTDAVMAAAKTTCGW